MVEAAEADIAEQTFGDWFAGTELPEEMRPLILRAYFKGYTDGLSRGGELASRAIYRAGSGGLRK